MKSFKKIFKEEWVSIMALIDIRYNGVNRYGRDEGCFEGCVS